MNIEQLQKQAKEMKFLPRFRRDEMCQFIITDLDLEHAQERAITIQPKTEFDCPRIKTAVDYTFHAYPINDNGEIGASAECKTTIFGDKESADITILELFRPESKQEVALFRGKTLPVFAGLCTYICGDYVEEKDENGERILIQEGDIYTISNITKMIKGVK